MSTKKFDTRRKIENQLRRDLSAASDAFTDAVEEAAQALREAREKYDRLCEEQRPLMEVARQKAYKEHNLRIKALQDIKETKS